MNKIFYYGEYEFPQDIKDLYFGLPGTGILKIFLDQYIQELESISETGLNTQLANAMILKNSVYDDSAIYKWNGRRFAFAIQLLNKDAMDIWLDARLGFVTWVKNTQDIELVHYEFGTKSKDIDTDDLTVHMKYFAAKKYFFEDLPKSRGMDPRNLITGVPKLVSDKS